MICFSLMYIQFSGFRLHVIHHFSIIIHSSSLLFVLFVTAGKQTLWNRLVSHTGGKYLGVHFRPVYLEVISDAAWLIETDLNRVQPIVGVNSKKNMVGQQIIFENQVVLSKH